MGAGQRSQLWLRLMAAALGLVLVLPGDADLSATMGAARLGASSRGRGPADAALTAPVAARASMAPDPALAGLLTERRARWSDLRTAAAAEPSATRRA